MILALSQYSYILKDARIARGPLPVRTTCPFRTTCQLFTVKIYMKAARDIILLLCCLGQGMKQPRNQIPQWYIIIAIYLIARELG